MTQQNPEYRSLCVNGFFFNAVVKNEFVVCITLMVINQVMMRSNAFAHRDRHKNMADSMANLHLNRRLFLRTLMETLLNVQPAKEDCSPRVKSPPKSQNTLKHVYHASEDGTDENLLILLHGLGELHFVLMVKFRC